MIRILTFVNTGVLVTLIGGGAFVFSQRTAIKNQIIDQALTVVKESISSKKLLKIPPTTGPAIPFR
tara:strand:+ start:50 stop:247 length:198 start_codon:yes stop_codon:yes gene_type:complete